MKPEDFESICFALERTHKGLLSICKEHGYNTESPFRNFISNNEEAELRYARAREKQIDYLDRVTDDIGMCCRWGDFDITSVVR